MHKKFWNFGAGYLCWADSLSVCIKLTIGDGENFQNGKQICDYVCYCILSSFYSYLSLIDERSEEHSKQDLTEIHVCS